MTNNQHLVITSFAYLNTLVWLYSLIQIKKGNVFSLATPLQSLGIFVWGDALLIAPYWIVTSLLSLYLGDWLFFLLTISVFWVIRGLGETIYWLNQQFSPILREPPQKFWHYRFVNNDSVWFLNQVFAQIITATSLLITLILLKLWLPGR